MGSNGKHEHTNKLIEEISPYLRQHAHNPVDWYPWGKEALVKAEKENKPIFLSIGYAACHWCHVMERESFENAKIAEILNEHFISIKVDREERPDLDDIYMTAVVAISGSGGWPMTVFLTPDLKPFYGGTYFPPEDRWGRIGFKNLILRLNELWTREQSRKKLLHDAETLRNLIGQQISTSVFADSDGSLDNGLLDAAVRQLESAFDDTWGGFGGAPKFPPSNAIKFLLRDQRRRRHGHSLDMAVLTLDKMYEGGIFDHIAGGFHRYSVDNQWLVPHFEKMLYDNAQLAVAYIEAFQATCNPRYARVAKQILAYEMGHMTGPEGEIFATEDADSEGKEGIFYLWSRDEISKILGRKETEILSRYYNVKESGNFSSHEEYHKGLNILHIRKDPAAVAQELDMSEENLENALSGIRQKLADVRSKRVRPGLDDKVIASWNALMITAFARGYETFADERYLKASERAAVFMMDRMRTEDGKLLRIHRAGKSKLHGYLEDYAYTIRAFTDLYEACFDIGWLAAAEALTDEMISQFWEEKSASLFNTSHYHKNLIVRARSTNDSAIPSPAGMAIDSLLRLGKLLDKDDYLDKARRLLEAHQPYMEKAPQGYLTLLMGVDSLLNPSKEIVVVGPKGSGDTKKLLNAIHSLFLPNRVIAFLDPMDEEAERLADKIPLLRNRETVGGKSTAFVCENYACQRPVTTPDELIAQLSEK